MLYSDNREAIISDLADEAVKMINSLSDEEKRALFGGTEYSDEDVAALYEANKDAIVEEFLDIILAKYGTVPETVSAESPVREPITVPVFGEPVVSVDATEEEYMNARDEARSAEIARLLEYLDI